MKSGLHCATCGEEFTWSGDHLVCPNQHRIHGVTKPDGVRVLHHIPFIEIIHFEERPNELMFRWKCSCGEIDSAPYLTPNLALDQWRHHVETAQGEPPGEPEEEQGDEE